MKLLLYPDPGLNVVCKAVDKITPELVDTAHEMYKLMKDSGGIGLAANQIGLDIKLIVIENQGNPLIMFNPIILAKSKELITSSEACLSFPNVHRIIQRASEVTVKYRDTKGKMKHEVYKGLQSRVILHEIQHLSGKTFLDSEEKIKWQNQKI